MSKKLKEEEIEVEQKVVPVPESETLQKEGWEVVGVKTVEGKKVHILEKK